MVIQNQKATSSPAALSAKKALQNRLIQTAQKNKNSLGSNTSTIPNNNVNTNSAKINTTNKLGIPSTTNQTNTIGPTNFNTGLNQTSMQAQNVDPRWNSNQTVPDYLGMTPDMIKNALNGMSSGSQYYDPDQDPVYKSMVELSQKQADKAGLQAMELLNERGILNSAVTVDRLGQIKQGASDAVLASIPGLASAFDNKQAQNSASMQNLLGTLINAGQFQQTFAEDNLRFDKGFNEDNRRYDKQFALDESAVTGKYISPEAAKAVQDILKAKQAYEGASVPNDQREQLHADANAARQLLASMGVDTNAMGADSSYRQAMEAFNGMGGPGITTMNNRQQQMNNALATGELTGKYTPAGSQALVSELLRIKQDSEKRNITADERKSNSTRATQIRNQLSGFGINADELFGAGVTAQQAAANAKLMGTQTEGKRQFDAELK
ncbi:MAG: hypothetical protein RR595_12695 [Lysinibacillus sp.]